MKQFIQRHWPTILKTYKQVLYITRASLLLYVAWFAIQNSFYAWAIAFIYFAFVDYWNKFHIEGIS